MPRPIVEPEIIETPFTIVIDTNESMPYSFTGIDVDGDQHGRHYVPRIVRKPLWSMGRETVSVKGREMIHGLADYSIDGMELLVQVERKSVSDLYSTLGQRRDEFEAEMARLSRCRYAAVVVEGDWQKILVEHGSRSNLNPKSVSRTILSWSVRYGIHWWTCTNRRHAELVTFQLLMRFWKETQAMQQSIIQSVVENGI